MTASSASVFAQQTPATEKPFYFEELKSRLIYRDKKVKTDNQLNRLLIAEIDRRKVDFLLTKDNEAELRKLKAGDSLIRKIRQSVPESRRARLRTIAEMNEVYSRVINNYKSRKAEDLAIAVDAGRQFIKLYSTDPEAQDQSDFIRAMLPRLEKLLATARSKGTP